MAEELAELAMEGASLEASLHPHPDGFGPNGSETVELRVATNPGIPASPLRDAASGGELSRIMLALTGLGSGAGAGTLVFDEIDAGIGGSTARTVAERLRRLGAERQVICITHLPQVASLAGAHFRIEKRTEGGRARATVDRVDGDELVAEIVRMLGAEAKRRGRQPPCPRAAGRGLTEELLVSWFPQRVGGGANRERRKTDMETETPEAPEIEELPEDPDTDMPEPDELPEDPDTEMPEPDELPLEDPGEPLPGQVGEPDTEEVQFSG